MHRKNPDLTTDNIFNLLPDEAILNILSFLDRKHLFAILLTDARLNRLAEDNHVWFRFFKSENKPYQSDIQYKVTGKTRLTQLAEIQSSITKFSFIADTIAPKGREFYDFFRDLAFTKGELFELVPALIGTLLFQENYIKKYGYPCTSKTYVFCTNLLTRLFPQPLTAENKMFYLDSFVNHLPQDKQIKPWKAHKAEIQQTVAGMKEDLERELMSANDKKTVNQDDLSLDSRAIFSFYR